MSKDDPHAGPWRIEHPEHLTAPLLLAADDTELYYLERVSANEQDDTLVAAAPMLAFENQALRLALEGAADYIRDVCGTDAVPVLQQIGAVLAATAPAAPGGLRIPDLPPIAAERIAAVLDGLTPPEDDEDN